MFFFYLSFICLLQPFSLSYSYPTSSYSNYSLHNLPLLSNFLFQFFYLSRIPSLSPFIPLSHFSSFSPSHSLLSHSSSLLSTSPTFLSLPLNLYILPFHYVFHYISHSLPLFFCHFSLSLIYIYLPTSLLISSPTLFSLSSPVVNFINILPTNFSYESCFGSFTLVTCTQKKLHKQRLYEKISISHFQISSIITQLS